jgi:hypothetical protein
LKFTRLVVNFRIREICLPLVTWQIWNVNSTVLSSFHGFLRFETWWKRCAKT